jgi:4'-phosphopantetheinyl transferase
VEAVERAADTTRAMTMAPDPVRDGVHVQVASVADLVGGAPPPASWMTADESRRLDALRAPSRAAQFVAGRWLARQLLSRHLGCCWRQWALTAPEDGPPVANGPGPASLSISHSGDHVACAVSAGAAIGIDIESVVPRNGLGALILAVSSAAERAALPALQGDDEAALREAFFILWTAKEAWLKRNGGELFGTMLGGAVALTPATVGAANTLTWRHADAVVALCADNVAMSMASAASSSDPGGHRHWTVCCPGPAR